MSMLERATGNRSLGGLIGVMSGDVNAKYISIAWFRVNIAIGRIGSAWMDLGEGAT